MQPFARGQLSCGCVSLQPNKNASKQAASAVGGAWRQKARAHLWVSPVCYAVVRASLRLLDGLACRQRVHAQAFHLRWLLYLRFLPVTALSWLSLGRRPQDAG